MMKKHLPGFLAGLIAATLVFSLAIPALAESGAIGTFEFNAVGLTQNGETVFSPGEDYLLPNGYSAPTSVLFTDPSGNGTTYLPLRQLAALLGVDLTWDAATGNIILASKSHVPAVAEPIATPAPTAAS